MRLIAADGRATTLAAFRGKWVIFAPSLTLCQEVCPMTTGALTSVMRTLAHSGLGRRVVVAEVSVDPWRDTSARLRAYRRLTGLRFQLLTGTRPELRHFWRFFGVSFRRTTPARPAPSDWLTHRPETMDVEHTDGLFILGPDGHERIAVVGMPNVGGRLAPSLRRLLDAEGRHNLAHPEASWSSRQVLQDLDWLRGTSPPAGPPSDLAQTTPARSLAGLAGSPTPLSKLHQQAGALLGWSSALRARIRSLHDYPIVINVWASWCSPCREEFPLFAAASAAFGRRVAFLGVNVEDQSAAAQSFLTDHPVSYPSYQSSTGELSGLAQIEGTPTTIYLSPGGHLSFVHTGEYGNLQSLEADIGRYALAAPAVRTATMPRTPER